MSKSRSARHLREVSIAAALMPEPGQRAWPSGANHHGGETVLNVTLALGFDEAMVPASPEVAAGIDVGGGRNA